MPLPSTISVQVGAGNVTAAPLGPVASAVMFAGTKMVGGVVSRTVTLKVTTALSPELSRADVHTSTVVVIGKVEPDAGLQLTERLLPLRSVTVGEVKLTTAPLGPVASVTMSGGWVAVNVDGAKKFSGLVVVPGSAVVAINRMLAMRGGLIVIVFG
jgi:hypothetical protein